MRKIILSKLGWYCGKGAGGPLRREKLQQDHDGREDDAAQN